MDQASEEDLCTICHRTKEDHKNSIHSFSPYGNPTGLFQKSPERPGPSDQPRAEVKLPSVSDPILRMVLLRKGLISVADIEEVEQELRATGVSGHVPAVTLG